MTTSRIWSITCDRYFVEGRRAGLKAGPYERGMWDAFYRSMSGWTAVLYPIDSYSGRPASLACSAI